MHNYPQFTSVKESIGKKSRQIKNNLAESVQKIRIARILPGQVRAFQAQQEMSGTSRSRKEGGHQRQRSRREDLVTNGPTFDGICLVDDYSTRQVKAPKKGNRYGVPRCPAACRRIEEEQRRQERKEIRWLWGC
jgi:hypothetical protein